MRLRTKRALRGLSHEIDVIAKSYALCFLAENPGKTGLEVLTFLEGRGDQIIEDLSRMMVNFAQQAETGLFRTQEDYAKTIELAKKAFVKHIIYQIGSVCE